MISRLKPPLSATLLEGHPLAQGMIACFLANELGGAIHDLVSGNILPLQGSGAFGTANFGQGLDCQANDSGAYASAWDKLKEPSNQFTILWRGIINASPSNFAALCNVTYTNSDSSPFLAYGIQINSGSNGYFFGWNNIGTGASFSANTSSAFDGTERQIVGVVRGNLLTAANALYEGPNANPIGTNTQVCAIQYTANSKMGLGVYQTSIGRNSKTIIRHAYIWKRALTPSEIQWLYADPYAFIQNGQVRKFYKYTSAPLSQTASDAISTYLDSVALSNSAAANYGVTAGDQLSLADAISLVGPPPDYKILLGDAFSNIQDSARTVLGLREQFTDSVNNLVDAFSKMMGIPVSVFDSQQFNWADAIATSFGAPLSVSKSDSINNLVDHVNTVASNVKINLTFSDTINHLADTLRIWAILRIATGDNLDFSDSLMTRFSHLMRIAELLPSWLDSPLVAKTSKPAFSDSVNNLNDSVSIALTVNLRLSKGDTVNLLSDSVSLLLSTSYNLSDIQRIRRYLGDTQSS